MGGPFDTAQWLGGQRTRRRVEGVSFPEERAFGGRAMGGWNFGKDFFALPITLIYIRRPVHHYHYAPRS